MSLPPEAIPFARPFIGKEEEEAVLRVLRSGWLTTGKEAAAFEEEFASFLGAARPGEKPPYCLAVNSATSALHLALAAAGVGPGDKVLVPSYTFSATAMAAVYLGADPVFADVSPGGFHMDPASLERALERLPPGSAKAVIPVHFGGLPLDMAPIKEIASRYGLFVIEDAAHAFPSLTPEGCAGTLGDAGAFSFYATKTITTGEGGMVVTRDRAIAERVSRLRSNGIDRGVWDRYTNPKASWYYEVIEAGYKYNLPDLLAAVGREQLKRAEALLSARQTIAAVYDAAFAADPRFTIPPTGPGDARHLYPLRVNPEALPLSRDQCIERLQARGVGVSVHFIPLHTMPYYKNRYALNSDDCPEALNTYRRVISLPIWPAMTAAQTSRVIEEVMSLPR